MLKGVNKQAIEISRPESAYFEKIIFFVKPECAGMNERRLYKEAENVTERENRAPVFSPKQKRSRVKEALFLLLSAGVGSAVTLLTVWLT